MFNDTLEKNSTKKFLEKNIKFKHVLDEKISTKNFFRI